MDPIALYSRDYESDLDVKYYPAEGKYEIRIHLSAPDIPTPWNRSNQHIPEQGSEA
jgi:hypothetical protein